MDEFVLATPVVLWAGGMFFSKAWRSLVNRSLNMFTLIAQIRFGFCDVDAALALEQESAAATGIL